MQRVGSRELKNRLGRYLQMVRRGKTLIITDRGKPVAKVSPPDDDVQPEPTLMDVLRRLNAEGKIRLAKGRIGKFRAVPSRGKPASQMILEDRR